MTELWKPQPKNLATVDAAAFETLLAEIQQTGRLEETDLRQIDHVGIDLREVDWKGCRAASCRFAEGLFQNGYIQNTVFDRCDFSSADLSNCVFSRVEFHQCKLVGASLAGSGLNDVLFEDCVMEHGLFTLARTKKLLFRGCQMRDIQLDELSGKDYYFEECDLTRANFHQTKLGGVDLRSDEISGIAASQFELKGARVTTLQACDLAKLLGVLID